MDRYAEFCHALGGVFPVAVIAMLMVMKKTVQIGSGFDVALDIVVQRAFDGPVARNDLAWLICLSQQARSRRGQAPVVRCLQQVLGELPAGWQAGLLGEVVGAGHGTLWLRLQQVLGEAPAALAASSCSPKS